jgi:RNA polymerase sigma-70 factor (sigma-E family)
VHVQADPGVSMGMTGESAWGVAVTEDAAGEYERFVRSRTPALLRSAYLLTGDQHLAEDLVQEALARTHRAWPGLYRSGNAEAYARKVMYHAQVSIWRRRKGMVEYPGELPDRATAGDQDQAAVLRITLMRALRTLSPRQRAVIVLRYFEDRTERETAELMGVALGTVKAQTARALERLRTIAPQLSGFETNDGVPR